MEEAIGSNIADYLIKPVNPNQILLSIKKNLDQSKLVSQKTNSNYQVEFRQLGMLLNGRLDARLFDKTSQSESNFIEYQKESGSKQISFSKNKFQLPSGISAVGHVAEWQIRCS